VTAGWERRRPLQWTSEPLPSHLGQGESRSRLPGTRFRHPESPSRPRPSRRGRRKSASRRPGSRAGRPESGCGRPETRDRRQELDTGHGPVAGLRRPDCDSRRPVADRTRPDPDSGRPMPAFARLERASPRPARDGSRPVSNSLCPQDNSRRQKRDPPCPAAIFRGFGRVAAIALQWPARAKRAERTAMAFISRASPLHFAPLLRGADDAPRQPCLRLFARRKQPKMIGSRAWPALNSPRDDTSVRVILRSSGTESP
jgi:hypothetical protein